MSRMAYEIGRNHGTQTMRYCSRREAEGYSPGWTDEEINAYLNGRDAAVDEAISKYYGRTQ